MTTLISIYNDSGCVGRCDARCYNAKHEHCHCVCGGANHGKGLEQALANTREHHLEWLKKACADGPVTELRWTAWARPKMV